MALFFVKIMELRNRVPLDQLQQILEESFQFFVKFIIISKVFE